MQCGGEYVEAWAWTRKRYFECLVCFALSGTHPERGLKRVVNKRCGIQQLGTSQATFSLNSSLVNASWPTTTTAYATNRNRSSPFFQPHPTLFLTLPDSTGWTPPPLCQRSPCHVLSLWGSVSAPGIFFGPFPTCACFCPHLTK